MIDKIAAGQTDLVFEYIESGHSPTSVDGHGVSLVQWCAYYGDVTAIKFLLSKGASLDSLGKNYDLNGAAFHGHFQLCQFLLAQGADPNHPLPDTGETPLHAVLTKANRPVNNQIVGLLLEHGAHPNTQTKPGVETEAFMRDIRTRQETPLHRAAAYGDATTIQLLLNAGADKTLKDMNCDTPLTWASWHLRTRQILSMLCYGTFSVKID